ncbi:hypothetical protein L227DRAFT_188999 [Lentinus tigrinus ALCF2SS1-6]|uniref:Uncharacterized protein n=1 Tax=Lentinus tigrinus ALCF2SS1-6 TaxID=1328759 RepID=A0A5C2S4I4_9APHY|nr:hypothetical protein L227DRAFT_188999 [Lentinus tigrinus ALCF2SS1-6]
MRPEASAPRSIVGRCAGDPILITSAHGGRRVRTLLFHIPLLGFAPSILLFSSAPATTCFTTATTPPSTCSHLVTPRYFSCIHATTPASSFASVPYRFRFGVHFTFITACTCTYTSSFPSPLTDRRPGHDIVPCTNHSCHILLTYTGSLIFLLMLVRNCTTLLHALMFIIMRVDILPFALTFMFTFAPLFSSCYASLPLYHIPAPSLVPARLSRFSPPVFLPSVANYRHAV